MILYSYVTYVWLAVSTYPTLQSHAGARTTLRHPYLRDP
jgi:hypothetical protein